MQALHNTDQTHQVTVDGAQITVYEHGAGLPVLMLHGSPDTYAMWLPLINELGDGFRSIAIDLPGFGYSTLPGEFTLTLDHMADFVGRLVDALGIQEPLALVTIDFGGHYGMAFAAKYPERVKGIVISNTNFFHDYQWHSFAKLYRLPVVGELLMASSSKSTIEKTLKQFAPMMPAQYIADSYATGFGSPRVRKAILRMYRERNSQDFVGWEDRLLTALKQIPSLVLWGDKDPFITPVFADRYPGAKVHHFTEYSHWVPLEAPAEYGAKLKPWLERL